MSRNMGRTSCKFCGGEVKMIEAPRPLRPEDTHGYFGHGYDDDMIVAAAECVDCCAKYLAWVELPSETMGHMARREGDLRPFVDLSFRSTFDDEPGADDLPEYEIERVPVRKPWPYRCRICNLKLLEHRTHKRIHACDPCEELTWFAAMAIAQPHSPADVAAVLMPHTFNRLIELPELRQRLDAAKRLGATVDDVRELAREMLPLAMPPVST